MVAYPTSLASNNTNLINNNNNHHLNRVPEDAETGTGNITPSHGGLVTGYEFDIPIAQRPPAIPADIPTNNLQTQAQGPTPPLTPLPHAITPTAVARPPSSSSTSNRQRPLSMPPQSHLNPPTPQQESSDNHSSNGRSSSTRQADSSSIPRSKSSNRILGDYTLSKTLGAGSMGKVKLAHHNITGEKV